jgi:hypothetical protein
MTTEFKARPAEPNKLPSQRPADDNLRELMEGRIKTFNPFRRARVPEWNINIAYLSGFQYIGIAGGHITEVPRAQLSPFSSTVNKIAPAVRNDVALATKNAPKFDIVPETTDEADRATAIAGEEMFSYLRRLNNFDEQRSQIILWYDIASIAWRKQYWDPFFKVVRKNPEEGEEGHNPNLPGGAPIHQGEALSEHTPPNEVIWDWRQRTDKLPWIIHARPMRFSEVRARYGDIALQIPESAFLDPNADLNEFEIKIFTTFATQFNTGGTSGKVTPDISDMADEDRQVMIYEFWQVIDDNYPEGVFGVMAGFEPGLILQNEPYPIETYPHGEIPFVGYDMLVADKAVSGTASRISQARPLQDELNEIRTSIRENFAVMGGGIVHVPRDAKVNLRRIDNAPGLFLEYDGPFKVTREGGTPISGDAFAYQASVINDINDIFSFPQVAQGKRPQGGPKSGVGIALLQEASTTQHSPIISQMDRKDERAVRQLLSIAFANYQQRTFQIVGKDNQWSLFEYDPSSYNTRYNVHVRTGSSLPISKSIERDLTLGLMQTGLLGNPQDPTVRKRILETIDIGGADKILRDNARDTNFAKLEFITPVQQYQQLVEQGVDPEQIVTDELVYLPAINPFDNHEVHVVEHKNDLLDKFFEYLGSGDPVLQMIAQAMQEHWAQHAEILAEQQLQQAIMTGQIKAEDIESSQEKESAKTEKE